MRHLVGALQKSRAISISAADQSQRKSAGSPAIAFGGASAEKARGGGEVSREVGTETRRHGAAGGVPLSSGCCEKTGMLMRAKYNNNGRILNEPTLSEELRVESLKRRLC